MAGYDSDLLDEEEDEDEERHNGRLKILLFWFLSSA